MAVYNDPEICVKCSAKCCRYFMLQIDTPRSRADFENIRWYLCHRDVTIYSERGKWYIHMDSPCRQLTADGRCSIYESRPQICREHSPKSCEFDSEFSASLTFRTLEELNLYLTRRFSRGSSSQADKEPVISAKASS